MCTRTQRVSRCTWVLINHLLPGQESQLRSKQQPPCQLIITLLVIINRHYQMNPFAYRIKVRCSCISTGEKYRAQSARVICMAVAAARARLLKSILASPSDSFSVYMMEVYDILCSSQHTHIFVHTHTAHMPVPCERCRNVRKRLNCSSDSTYLHLFS